MEGVRSQWRLPGGRHGAAFGTGFLRMELKCQRLSWDRVGLGSGLPGASGLQEGPQGAEGQLWAAAWIPGAARTAPWSCRFGGKHLILFVFNQPCSLCSHQNPLVACGPHVGQEDGGRPPFWSTR